MLYCLFEEYEKINGQYKNNLLALSTEKDLLQELMRAKVAADEHGLVAQKGVKYFDKDTFETNSDFNFGFLRYYIVNESTLSRQELMDKIRTEKSKASATFEETIWDYPKSKATRSLMTECREGWITQSSLLDFLTECYKEAGLTKNDLQTIKKSKDCQSLLLNELDKKIKIEDRNQKRVSLRDFYSEERKAQLLQILKTAYIKYTSKNARYD